MATHKYIYWRPDMPRNAEGQQFANVHLLVGYNQQTIADFQKMADELRKTFPQAKNDEIQGGRVHKSSSVNNHTIISWNAYIPEGDYKEWREVKDGKCEYCY